MEQGVWIVSSIGEEVKEESPGVDFRNELDMGVDLRKGVEVSKVDDRRIEG